MIYVARTNGSEYVFIFLFFFPSNETSADSLSQSKEDQAGALGAADHLGNADFLFLEQVGGTFPDVRDAEPDAVLAEVRNAGKESDKASCARLGGEKLKLWFKKKKKKGYKENKISSSEGRKKNKKIQAR